MPSHEPMKLHTAPIDALVAARCPPGAGAALREHTGLRRVAQGEVWSATITFARGVAELPPRYSRAGTVVGACTRRRVAAR